MPSKERQSDCSSQKIHQQVCPKQRQNYFAGCHWQTHSLACQADITPTVFQQPQFMPSVKSFTRTQCALLFSWDLNYGCSPLLCPSSHLKRKNGSHAIFPCTHKVKLMLPLLTPFCPAFYAQEAKNSCTSRLSYLFQARKTAINYILEAFILNSRAY